MSNRQLQLERTAMTEPLEDIHVSLNSTFHIALGILPYCQETEAGMGSLVSHNKSVPTCQSPWTSNSIPQYSVKEVLVSTPSFKELSQRPSVWAPGVLESLLNLESWDHKDKSVNSPLSSLIFCTSLRPGPLRSTPIHVPQFQLVHHIWILHFFEK